MEVELGPAALLLSLVLGVVSGGISVWVFPVFSNTRELRTAINRVLAHLLEFRLFADEPAIILQAQRRLLLANLRVLRYCLVPSLMLAVPFAILLAGADAFLGRAAILPGKATTVTIQTTPAELAGLSLRVPAGFIVETPSVSVPAEHQTSWRVRPVRPSSGEMQILSGPQTITKSISSQRTGLRWLSPRRSNLAGFLLHPLELPFTDSAIRWVALEYPAARIFGLHWLVWFLLGSLAGSAAALLVPARVSRPALVVFACLVTPVLRAETISPLAARGYTVVPQPQRVTLRPGDFRFGPQWRLQLGAGLDENSPDIQTLIESLQQRHQLKLSPTTNAGGPALTLEVQSDAVSPGPSQDKDRPAILEQAYRLELQPAAIRISANSRTGLFYGIQTFIQLLKQREDALWLPEGEITDWPDLQQRHIYWDDAHHLETLPTLEAAIRDAAFFKINGFVIKLEGHFRYRSAPSLVEPQALTPEEFQQLTDYGLRYHVQVIPYLDAPAHIAFILKHPEYAKLRAFPDSNYELCTTNPDALKLMYGMFDDLLAANQGIHYFYLSTDEAYYVGWAENSQCNETSPAKQLGSRGKLLAQFVTRTASYLHDRGRNVVFWGEYPLKPDDIPSLPSFVINGETYGEKFDPLFRARGIRQMIYQPTEGEEQLFPHYFLLPPSRRLHPLQEEFERVTSALSQIASDPARQNADLMGLVVAGWGDMGLHPQTFWLGYAAITAAGWHAWSAGPDEAMSSFYPLFYGSSARNMNRLYQLMSLQAQTWLDSWDTADSRQRKPIWGDSDGIFQPPKPAHDQQISLPPMPDSGLQVTRSWSRENADRLRLAGLAMSDNDELSGLLQSNLQLATFHLYDLEVFLAITHLCRQNLQLLASFGRIDQALTEAAGSARQGEATKALEAIDRALAEAQEMRTNRNRALSDATGTWYKSWLPRVPEANGRQFLHELDDVKDHLPDRTVDMSYLVYRQLNLPLQEWFEKTETARNQFAAAHNLPSRTAAFNWKAIADE